MILCIPMFRSTCVKYSYRARGNTIRYTIPLQMCSLVHCCAVQEYYCCGRNIRSTKSSYITPFALYCCLLYSGMIQKYGSLRDLPRTTTQQYIVSCSYSSTRMMRSTTAVYQVPVLLYKQLYIGRIIKKDTTPPGTILKGRKKKKVDYLLLD